MLTNTLSFFINDLNNGVPWKDGINLHLIGRWEPTFVSSSSQKSHQINFGNIMVGGLNKDKEIHQWLAILFCK